MVHPTYRPQDTVRCVTEAQGAILLDLRAGKYFSLDEVGARIWRRLEKGETLGEISRHLQNQYRAPADQIDKDVETFVLGLEAKGLIRGSV